MLCKDNLMDKNKNSVWDLLEKKIGVKKFKSIIDEIVLLILFINYEIYYLLNIYFLNKLDWWR